MIRRRDFISLLGGSVATWPLAAHAQQSSMPAIGFLHPGSPKGARETAAALRQGLAESGFAEGRNLTIEYRYAENQMDRLPGLAIYLTGHRLTAIFARGLPAVLAARAATSTIPIVFSIGEDPVKEGIVPSLNNVGGNVTGFSDFTNQLAGKRLGLMRETVPAATSYGLLVNSSNPNATPDTKDVQAAADSLGLELRVFRAATEPDLEIAFADMAQQKIGALFVNIDFLFFERREQIARLAARQGIPAFYPQPEYVTAGGLMSYGPDTKESVRQAGIYVGRILKGETPANLPVQQATKFDLVINLKTAKALGLTIPQTLLATADEVIE